MWRARRHADLTQQQLGQHLGLGLRSVKDYEADKRTPKRGVLLGWAVACGVDPIWLEHGYTLNTDGPDGGIIRHFTTRLVAA